MDSDGFRWIQMVTNGYRWIIFSDIDEYIYARNGNNQIINLNISSNIII